MTIQDSHSLPSNRTFGGLFVVVFGIVCAWSFYKQSAFAWMWGGLSILVLLASLFVPAWLTPFNRLWMWIGSILHQIVSPVVIGALYFVLITPVALMLRLTRRDPLRLVLDPAAQTYWVKREPPGPDKASFLRQF